MTSGDRRSRFGVCAGVLACALLPATSGAQSFTHVHLRSPDPAGAAEWYQTLLGGELRPSTGGMGSVGHIHGSISTMLDDGTAAPSHGSVIDHFGFAVPNVAAIVRRAGVMGGLVVREPYPGTTANTIAMIEDPWGTRVELLESPDFTGIQHVHLVTEDIDALRDWLLTIFGGEYDATLGGEELHAIRYDGVWVYVSEPVPDPEPEPAAEADPGLVTLPESEFTLDLGAPPEMDTATGETTPAPSRGRALDHMGFSVGDMDEIVSRIRASGFEPYVIRPNRPGGTTLLMFFEGAHGVHFEIAQPDGVR